MPRSRREPTTADELAILSATWILACNDENPLMTYRGLRLRLELETAFDIERLVCSHAELFRVRGGAAPLRSWQDQMLQGRDMPSWIAGIADQAERAATITSLTPRDIFRSQFRSNSSSTGRSSTEVIEWGLKHIERLSKTSDEARQVPWTRLSTFWVPVLSALIAVAALATSTFQQLRSLQIDKQTRQFEVAAPIKSEAYSTLMSNLAESFSNAVAHKTDLLSANVARAEGAYFRLQPYLSVAQQDAVWKDLKRAEQILQKLAAEMPNANDGAQFGALLDSFRTILSRQLFDEPGKT